MKIKLWRGYHDLELPSLIARAWSAGELLILCPPLSSDFSFLRYLPAKSELKLVGNWDANARKAFEIAQAPRENNDYPFPPLLGVFTSGTVSGKPRLVLYSKENIEASLSAILALFDIARIDSVFCYPQPFHTFGLILGYCLTHKLGIPLFTPDGKYGRASHAKRLQCTSPGLLTLGTPTHFFDLLTESKKLSMAPSYSCIAGGAQVGTALWTKLRDDLKIEAPSIGYGCTEASPGITHLAPGTMPLSDGDIGAPLASLEANVITGKGVQISGASLCLAVIDEFGVQFPSSLIIRDEIEIQDNGVGKRWLYRGRLDLVLNRGGQKLSLERIERELTEKFAVQTIAFGLPDARLGQDLALAFCGSESGTRPSFVTKVSSYLEREHQIKLRDNAVFWFDEFPLNASAKIDRAAIQQLGDDT